MTFRHHTEKIAAKMIARLQQLRRLAGRSWGCGADDLRTVYLTYIRPVADYCGACYLPAASEATVRRLEIVQRQAARIITGCVASTPVNALEREANLMPLRLRGQQLAGYAYLRARSKPDDNPLHRLITDCDQRRKRLKVERSWLPRGSKMVLQARLRCRPSTMALPPWEPWPNLDIRPDLAYPPADRTPASKREAAERTLADLPQADVVAWTDGSVRGDQTNGGAGFMIETRDAEKEVGRVAAGRHASSYAAELTAILAAARRLLHRLPHGPRRPQVRFCTDSRSVLQALATGPSTKVDSLFANVWQLLAALSRRCHVTLQWIPGHCDIAGNEEADVQAAAAGLLRQRRVPIAWDSARAVIRRTARRQWLERPQPPWHERAAGRMPSLAEVSRLPRADAVTVTQLRTGHSILLGSYRHRIGVAPSPTCQDCCTDDLDTAEHFLLDCPAHHQIRSALFSSPLLSDPFPLFAQPADVATFVRRAGPRAAPLMSSIVNRLPAKSIKTKQIT